MKRLTDGAQPLPEPQIVPTKNIPWSVRTTDELHNEMKSEDPWRLRRYQTDAAAWARDYVVWNIPRADAPKSEHGASYIGVDYAGIEQHVMRRMNRYGDQPRWGGLDHRTGFMTNPYMERNRAKRWRRRIK